MSESRAAFTPGPLKVAAMFGGNSSALVIAEDVYSAKKHQKIVLPRVGKDDPNVRLVLTLAAAPDLYAALVEAADHFEQLERKALHWEKTLGANELSAARWSEIKKHAGHRARVIRAALTKATGGKHERREAD